MKFANCFSGDDGYLSDDQESWEDDMKSLSEGNKKGVFSTVHF